MLYQKSDRLKRYVLILFLSLTALFSHAELPQKTPPPMKLSDPLPANIFSELAKIINPAVVNISTASTPRQGRFRNPIEELFEQLYGVQPIPRNVPRQTGLGTGFIVREDGLIVTNHHVVNGADIINVQIAEKDSKIYEATLIGGDERLDIALIKINPDKKTKLAVAALGSSKDVEVGEWVAAFGNAIGLGHTVTKGIISFNGREIGQINKTPLFQTDASINPGNSGGPLVNTKGYVIGVNSAIAGDGAQGIGFAIPIDAVKAAIPQLEENGSLRKGYLGVAMGDLDPAAAEYLGLEEKSGVVITDIEKGLPAHKAGIRPYDIIIEYNGKKIRNSLELTDAVADTEVGKETQVKILRNQKKLTLNVTVVERPSSIIKKRELRKSYQGQKVPFNLGLKVADLTDSIRKEWGISPDIKKPIVVEVERGGIASQAGIRVGDLILDVNKKDVESADQVLKFLKPSINSMRIARGNRIMVVMFDSKSENE